MITLEKDPLVPVKSLRVLNLYDNQWKCESESVRATVNWLRKRVSSVQVEQCCKLLRNLLKIEIFIKSLFSSISLQIQIHVRENGTGSPPTGTTPGSLNRPGLGWLDNRKVLELPAGQDLLVQRCPAWSRAEADLWGLYRVPETVQRTLPCVPSQGWPASTHEQVQPPAGRNSANVWNLYRSPVRFILHVLSAVSGPKMSQVRRRTTLFS